jgi:hypothetical protein
VLPHDHEEIGNEDGIIRRIHPHHVVFDPKIGGHKISTMALNPSSGPNGGLSVDLQHEIEEAGIAAEQFVMNPPWIAAIQYKAGQLRDEGLKVGSDPLPENPFHGEVWGSFTRSKQKKLLQLAKWLVELEGVALDIGK